MPILDMQYTNSSTSLSFSNKILWLPQKVNIIKKYVNLGQQVYELVEKKTVGNNYIAVFQFQTKKYTIWSKKGTMRNPIM